jgi:hypothetical protein
LQQGSDSHIVGFRRSSIRQTLIAAGSSEHCRLTVPPSCGLLQKPALSMNHADVERAQPRGRFFIEAPNEATGRKPTAAAPEALEGTLTSNAVVEQWSSLGAARIGKRGPSPATRRNCRQRSRTPKRKRPGEPDITSRNRRDRLARKGERAEKMKRKFADTLHTMFGEPSFLEQA